MARHTKGRHDDDPRRETVLAAQSSQPPLAPFSNALFVPPLLYLHAYALVTGRWPDRGWRHLLPGFALLFYQGAAFLLPLPLKQRWADIAFDDGETILAEALGVARTVPAY